MGQGGSMYLSKVGHFGCLTFYFLKKSSKIHKTLNKYVYTFRLKDILGPKTYKVLLQIQIHSSYKSLQKIFLTV